MALTLNLSPSDIIIPVMGATGAGKSTFIQNATGQHVEVGHGLESCTIEAQIFRGNIGGKWVYFNDTPGFDDSNDVEDVDVLQMIAKYLHQMSIKKLQVTSILFLHKITDNRFTGSSKRLQRVFEEVCGHDSFSSVILGTTGWDECKDSVGWLREKQLREKDFWGQMLQNGTDCRRLHNSIASATSMAEHLLAKQRTTLLMQQELIENEGDVKGTSAGIALDRLYSERISALEKRVADAELNARVAQLEAERWRLASPVTVVQGGCIIL